MKYALLIAVLVIGVQPQAEAKPGCWADNACKKQESLPPLTEVKDAGWLWECRPDCPLD
jgi:hypothetical protein